MTTTDYEQQALDFLEQTGVTINVAFKAYDFHFNGDKEKRDIYTITLSNGSRKYTFDFGNSINSTGKYQAVWGNQLLKFNSIPKYGSEERQSLRDSEIVPNPNYKIPTAYDVLACLQKYEVGTFDDFCSEFGYEFSNSTEYKVIKKTYKAVKKEFDSVQKLWNEQQIEQLQEIN